MADGVTITLRGQTRTIPLVDALDLIALDARVLPSPTDHAANADALARMIRTTLGLLDPAEAPGGGKDDVLLRLAGAADGLTVPLSGVEARKRGYDAVAATVSAYVRDAKPDDVARVAKGDFSPVAVTIEEASL